jgi:hypothetical protein
MRLQPIAGLTRQLLVLAQSEWARALSPKVTSRKVGIGDRDNDRSGHH